MERSQRIAILGPANPYRGGIAAFNENLALALMDIGHEVEMITFKFQYPDWIYPGDNQLTDSKPDQRLIIKRMIHSINPLNWWSVRRYLKRSQFDFIICPYWLPLLSPCFSFILMGLKKKTKVIGLLHNITPHEKRKGDLILTSLFLNRINEGVVLSDSVKRDLQTFKSASQIKVHHLFHPVYDHFGEKCTKEKAGQALALDDQCTYLLFFGIVRKYKGLDLLIRAFDHAVLPEHFKLIIAGEFYDDKEEYLSLIQSSGKSDRIHLYDEYIPDDRIQYFFSLSDVVVLPYRSATQSGVSQIAIHFELPVISSDVGGISEYIQNGVNGRLIDAEEEALIGALEEIRDEQVLVNWQKGQRERKKKLSWSSFVQLLNIS